MDFGGVPGWNPVYDWCFGSQELLKSSGSLTALMAYVSIEGILATNAVPERRLDLFIDVLVLTGKGRIGNSLAEADIIPVGDTEYAVDLPHLHPRFPRGDGH